MTPQEIQVAKDFIRDRFHEISGKANKQDWCPHTISKIIVSLAVTANVVTFATEFPGDFDTWLDDVNQQIKIDVEKVGVPFKISISAERRTDDRQ